MSAFQADHKQSAAVVQNIPRSLTSEPVAKLRSGNGIPRTERLVVLVPDGNLDETGLARCIWSLAISNQIEEVVYLAVVSDPDLYLSAERRLVNLSSITRDPRFLLISRVVKGNQWQRMISSLVRPGDAILVQQGQEERKRFWKHQNLAECLTEAGLSVYALDGYYQEKPIYPYDWKLAAVRWLVALLVIALFLILQVSVHQVEPGWVEIIIQILLLMLEIGILWFVSTLFV
jgi:hypothetical protein